MYWRFSANEPLWKGEKNGSWRPHLTTPLFASFPEELDEIKIEISVLSPMRKVNSVEEIEMANTAFI